jgi:hypothetical protein
MCDWITIKENGNSRRVKTLACLCKGCRYFPVYDPANIHQCKCKKHFKKNFPEKYKEWQKGQNRKELQAPDGLSDNWHGRNGPAQMMELPNFCRTDNTGLHKNKS